MQKGWLKNRLTPVKQKSAMWSAFADSVQSLVDKNTTPLLDRLKNRTSMFNMAKEDLDVVVFELGKFFTLGDVSDSDLPLVIMQREDEIHQKRTVYPLINTLNREFGGLGVSWEPLYAPTDLETYPYGSKFSIKSELNKESIPKEDWFLTSRGVIRVNINEIRNAFGDSSDPVTEFERRVLRVIYPLIPLRIVCDGRQYFIGFEVNEAKEFIRLINPTSITTNTMGINEATEVPDVVVSNIYKSHVFEVQQRDPRRLNVCRFDIRSLDTCRLDTVHNTLNYRHFDKDVIDTNKLDTLKNNSLFYQLDRCDIDTMPLDKSKTRYQNSQLDIELYRMDSHCIDAFHADFMF
ncbi:hypothetical protein I3271_05275 [Photobacterium leiognathi]|uniref:hypothetical protein n=1 Tax=Photobacterium leiognathi TaxID=553611 RepID=UPI001EDF96E4|nr:hypothetical protein [Photobacterium leiognathi]MCG3884091.1 hypothetical protein [Photobacterium leiognathi]